MRSLWLPNIKRFLTGTIVGGQASLNVNVINTIATAAAAFSYKERRFHLPATTAINGSGGAWVQLDVNSDTAGSTPANIANACSVMEINWNGGDALELGVGAIAGAVTPIGAVGAGQTLQFGVSLVVGNKVWVRTVKAAGSVAGELMVVFLG
jgi:hypothetical protein